MTGDTIQYSSPPCSTVQGSNNHSMWEEPGCEQLSSTTHRMSHVTGWISVESKNHIFNPKLVSLVIVVKIFFCNFSGCVTNVKFVSGGVGGMIERFHQIP